MTDSEQVPGFFSFSFPTIRRVFIDPPVPRLPNWRPNDWTVKLLFQINEDRLQQKHAAHTWLLKYRAHFGDVIRRGRLIYIREYLNHCPTEMIPICVLLIGKSTDRFRQYNLKAFAHHPSARVRRHLAKALRRLESWATLREMAVRYPDDEKIQWFAMAPTLRRSFQERLHNYQQHVDESLVSEVHTPSQMDFWSADRGWQRSPPKSIELIRRILRHIHRLVHWHAN
jgi:hypothetical protein